MSMSAICERRAHQREAEHQDGAVTPSCGGAVRQSVDHRAQPLRFGSHVEEQERELKRLLRRATQDRDRLVAALRENPPDEEQRPLYGELRRHLDRLVGYLRAERRARARERWRKERTMRRHLPAPQAEAVRRAARSCAAWERGPRSRAAPPPPSPRSSRPRRLRTARTRPT
ncbi:hypothetical protein ACIA8R_45990 [Nonomuraea sp. NPDC051191]|uniref:hypothetical protein n=1 Tax=Nonomuraea sp. NPDC051191 TaxID=3364372 RepID=UPI0037933262